MKEKTQTSQALNYLKNKFTTIQISKSTNFNSSVIRTLHSAHKGGFTLLELIAVIVVLGLIVSIAIPRIRFEPASYTLKKLERELITTFRMAQFTSLSENKDLYVYIDSKDKKISIVDSYPEIVKNEIVWKVLYTVYLDKNVSIDNTINERFIKISKYGFIDNLTIEIEIEDKKHELKVEKDGYDIYLKES